MVKEKYICGIRGHKQIYTEEYKGESGNVQADKICLRCGEKQVAWVGPSAQRIEDVCDAVVPSKEEVYEELPT